MLKFSVNSLCPLHNFTERDKMRSGADLNGDNLWIYRAYLRISDHCRVTVRLGLGLGLGLGLEIWLGLGLVLGLGLGLLIVVYKLLEKVTKCGSVT